ncbi:MAG: DUF5615 family PIN-like protein [Gemmataceae bacterium]
MKLLLDTCIWGGVKELLLTAGFDVLWVGDATADPGDEAILRIAHQQQRVLVTLDKDFGELAVVRGRPHHGIVRWCTWRQVVRLSSAPTSWRSTVGN